MSFKNLGQDRPSGASNHQDDSSSRQCACGSMSSADQSTDAHSSRASVLKQAASLQARSSYADDFRFHQLYVSHHPGHQPQLRAGHNN